MNIRIFFTLIIFGFFTTAHATDLAELNDSIQKHRTGIIVIQTTPGASVQVKQLRHEFWFGAAITGRAFDGRLSEQDANKYKEKFLENFNSVVTENALKWGNMEREKGMVNFATTDKILAWTDENDLPLRGHNIYWGIPKFVQTWIKELDDKELYDVLHTRARTISARYKDRFAEYDLNNEMIHGNYYEDRLGPDITGKMANWIKTYDPDAKLFLNDYDILTARMVRQYVQQIQELLDNGVQIDGIGVQGHLHSEIFYPDSLQFALDLLSQFNLPIKITEFNMPGQRSKFLKQKSLEMTKKEEGLNAQNLVDYYRICFAHPAVDGILMWGFWQGANWIPASSLYKKDWTPTITGEAYKSLIFDEWWTDFKGKSNNDGVCIVRAFYGTHNVLVDGIVKTITLSKENGSAYLEVGANK